MSASSCSPWTAGGAENAVFTQFVAHSEQMADRMVLVQLAHGMADFANTGLPWSSYISAYYPESHVAVPLTREVVTRPRVGLTGHIAGVVARTDNRVGAWQSAAGLSADVRGIAEFSRSVSRIQHAPINDQGINVMCVVNGKDLRALAAELGQDLVAGSLRKTHGQRSM